MRRANKRFARHLRENMTDAEHLMWRYLRNRHLMGCKFRRQHAIGPYIVDFVCLERKLIIELDGGQHTEENDAARTRTLEAEGYRLLRFWNNDVLIHIHPVLEAVHRALAQAASPFGVSA